MIARDTPEALLIHWNKAVQAAAAPGATLYIREQATGIIGNALHAKRKR